MTNKPPMPVAFKKRIRELRRNCTDAESLLWQLLRNRGFMNAKFRRQHPVGGFILDFYCDEAKLGIELDGDQHNEAGQVRYDQERTRLLSEQQDIQVIRFRNDDIMNQTEIALNYLQKILTKRLSLGVTEAGLEGARLPSPYGRRAGMRD